MNASAPSDYRIAFQIQSSNPEANNREKLEVNLSHNTYPNHFVNFGMLQVQGGSFRLMHVKNRDTSNYNLGNTFFLKTGFCSWFCMKLAIKLLKGIKQ